ncbi:MAG: DinB family protein [Fimbriimonadaceae bacterium]|nr:DinB family protein [Fimbriimonadaceae bacterium]
MHDYVIESLRLSPAIIARMLTQIPESRWDERQDPDRFTPREAIAHLADWDAIFLSRMQTAVEIPGSTVILFDEAELALENNYAGQGVAESLARFERCRGETVAWLIGLTPEQFKRHIVHPEKGSQTVDDIIAYVFSHDLYHFDHLTLFVGERTAGTW